MQEGIDPRKCINVIIRNWRWIAVITVAAMVTAAIVSFLLPAIYEVMAGVVIVKSKLDVAFEPRSRTLTEVDLARATDAGSQRKALEGLVKSNSVAAEVMAALESVLKPEERDVNALLEMVEMQSRGDLIFIKVKGEDPKKIVAIANAWGEAYETYINDLYGRGVLLPETIKTQVAEAKESYDKAAEALTHFLGDNQIDTLTREIADRRIILRDYYTGRQGLDHLIANAKALKDHLLKRTSPSATGDDLSISLLKASAFSLLSPGLPAQLQLSLEQTTIGEGSAEERVGELDTLIAGLEARREEVQSLISDPSIRQEILQLEEQLEREEARWREFSEVRDLSKETYQTLARKEAEVWVASQVPDVEVRFAVPALEPKFPVLPHRKVNIVIGGVLGSMMGVLAALVRNVHSARPKVARASE
jgi:uncharacterized protein involved in exopolysaccharide biosynthesis